MEKVVYIFISYGWITTIYYSISSNFYSLIFYSFSKLAYFISGLVRIYSIFGNSLLSTCSFSLFISYSSSLSFLWHKCGIYNDFSRSLISPTPYSSPSSSFISVFPSHSLSPFCWISLSYTCELFIYSLPISQTNISSINWNHHQGGISFPSLLSIIINSSPISYSL